jgi:branched-chain amino acid transport system substrate-binding protein
MQPSTTYIASIFSPDLTKIAGVRDFVKAYGEQNRDEDDRGEVPDFIASQGYEAVSILAQAYTRKRSAMPTDISAALRLLGDFDGLTGKVAFSENGDILKKPIFLKAYGPQESNRFACDR